MEDSPRRLGEENINDDEIDGSSKKRRTTQDFLDRWRRFSSKDSEVPFGILENKDSVEDDDDDIESESSDHLSKSAKKRFRRLRKLGLSPFLPQKKEVSNLSPESRTKETEKQEIDDDSSVEEILNSVSEAIEGENGKSIYEDKSETFTATKSERVDISDSDEFKPTPEQSTVNTDLEVPETESIEAILHRREKDELLKNAVAQHDPALNYYEQPKPIDAQPGVSNVEINNYNTPVGSLLAVDLLNYRIAKKRDNKNKVLNEKQHEQIKKDQKNIREIAEARLNKLEIQQNSKQNISEKDRFDSNKQLRTSNNNVIYNRTETSNMPNIVESTEHISVPQMPVEKSQNRVNTGRDSAPYAPQNFENTLQRLHEAELGKISSEFQFERRHEVMDEPGKVNAHLASTIQSDDADYGPSASHKPDSGTSGLSDRKDSTTNIPDETKQPVYKQAAITGFWGAIAGIIAFIIMYMLAS